MRYLLTSLLCVFTLSLTAQEAGCTYQESDNYSSTATFDDGTCVFGSALCGVGTTWIDSLQQCVVSDLLPIDDSCVGDLDGDGLRAVSDLLILLTVFGEPCTNDESEGNGSTCDGDCAHILYSNDLDYQFVGNDLLVYMFNNSTSVWTGFQGGTGGYNQADADVWVTWPGWSGTTNGSGNVPVSVDQLSYLFNQVTIPAGTTPATQTIYPAIIIPVALMDNDTYRLDDIGYDYTNNGGLFNSLSSNTGISSVIVNVSPGHPFLSAGENRVYYNVALNSNTNDANTYYYKGLTKTP